MILQVNDMKATVISVNKNPEYGFSKHPSKTIQLLEGLGVEGDVHMGKLVKHRSRVRKDPNQVNLRQVHLIHQELFDELKEKNYHISPGQIGENITTKNIDLLGLPKGTILKIGSSAEIEITGLRNPCSQLNDFQDGLMQELIYRNDQGEIIRKCGIMGVVKSSGMVNDGDEIHIEYPDKPFVKLEKV